MVNSPPASPRNPNDTTAEKSATSHVNDMDQITFNKIDPYLIHPSDIPATIFYQPLLQGDNYTSWQRGISKALNADGKLSFIDGTLPKPTNPVELQTWKRCDDLVCSWILNFVQHDIRSSCLYADCALTIWKDLQTRFSQSNGPKLYQLKTSIVNLKQEDMSITAYFTKLKSLWDEFDFISPAEQCICGASKLLIERLACDRVMEFMHGLHDRFSQVRSQILLLEPTPSSDKIFNLVKQEEAQQFINQTIAPAIDLAALQVHGTFGRPVRPQNNKRQRPFCDHCNRYGHTKATCYQIHGYPSKYVQAPNSFGRSSHSPTPSSATAILSHSTPSGIENVTSGTQIFTQDQYNRILALIDPPSLDDVNSPMINLTRPHH